METEKQRERLVELITEFEINEKVRCPKYAEPTCDGCEYDLGDECDKTSILADHLMSNNVVVLPCKIGDKAYYVDKGRMRETTVREIYFYTNNSWNMMLEFGCEEECGDCPFESWSQSYCGEWSCGGEYGTWTVDNDDFGKTVFLSREEAENVLKERKENDK